MPLSDDLDTVLMGSTVANNTLITMFCIGRLQSSYGLPLMGDSTKEGWLFSQNARANQHSRSLDKKKKNGKPSKGYFINVLYAFIPLMVVKLRQIIHVNSRKGGRQALKIKDVCKHFGGKIQGLVFLEGEFYFIFFAHALWPEGERHRNKAAFVLY